MNAVKARKYGDPEVLEIISIPKPEPKEDEILVKIYSSTVTPTDCASRKGSPFIIRFFSGLFRPEAILGNDFAGVVETIGEKVTRFKPGERVFGLSVNGGCNAEFICVSEKSVVTTIPKNLGFAEAASLNDGGLTALTFLRDKAKLKEGQSILINGASGSVGTAAVQIAKYFGATITAVCSEANFGLVTSLGAHETIDYTKQDFTKNGKTYDVIFDVKGNKTFAECKNSLTKQGIFLETTPKLGVALRTLFMRDKTKKRAIFAATGLEQTKESLERFKELLEQGVYKPVIDSRYELKYVKQAHEYVQNGHRSGNVVLIIKEENLFENK